MCAQRFLALSQSVGEQLRSGTISHKDTETLFSFCPSCRSSALSFVHVSLRLPRPLLHIDIQRMHKAAGTLSLRSDEVRPGKNYSFVQLSQCHERGDDAKDEKTC